MNERIQKLAEQAEKYADENFKGEPTYSEAYDSKFAELIVRECFEIVDDFGVEQAGMAEDHLGQNLLVSMKITEAAWKIKQHFGVEE